jgi:hypothetical protein
MGATSCGNAAAASLSSFSSRSLPFLSSTLSPPEQRALGAPPHQLALGAPKGATACGNAAALSTSFFSSPSHSFSAPASPQQYSLGTPTGAPLRSPPRQNFPRFRVFFVFST